MFPLSSTLYAILERELQPQFEHSLTFSSWIRYCFQQRQHSQMNLRIVVILRPSRERSLIPICTATFCKAKSVLTSQIVKTCSSYSLISSLKEEAISAIFFQQFLVVIHPSSSSDSLSEDEDFLRFLTGTEIHSSSCSVDSFLATSTTSASLFSSFSSTLASTISSSLFSSSGFSTISKGLVSSSEDSSSSEERSSLLYNSCRSSFSWMGGGFFLSQLSSPSLLQSMWVIAMSSRSTCDKEAISPVLLAKSLTNSSTLSSQLIVSMGKGKLSTNYLVFKSLSSARTSSVVTRRVVAPRLRILLIEMKALASNTAMDLRSVIVELLYRQQQRTTYPIRLSPLDDQDQHSNTRKEIFISIPTVSTLMRRLMNNNPKKTFRKIAVYYLSNQIPKLFDRKSSVEVYLQFPQTSQLLIEKPITLQRIRNELNHQTPLTYSLQEEQPLPLE